jgi:hypothetical protein
MSKLQWKESGYSDKDAPSYSAKVREGAYYRIKPNSGGYQLTFSRVIAYTVPSLDIAQDMAQHDFDGDFK